MTLNTSQLRRAWDPPCKGPWARVTLHGGAVVSVDPRTVEAVKALSAVLAKWNYKATPPDTGAYNCRRITGGSGYSLHAYGIAIDINWLSNPYGPRLITDMPRGMVDEIKALRTVNGKQVWGWGGDYRTNKDAMHYEIVCSPADLATGIKSQAIPNPPTEDDVPYSKWSKEDKEAFWNDFRLFGAPVITGARVDSIDDPQTNLGDVVNVIKSKAK